MSLGSDLEFVTVILKKSDWFYKNYMVLNRKKCPYIIYNPATMNNSFIFRELITSGIFKSYLMKMRNIKFLVRNSNK